ncbi:hypothetical protein [Dysgonomonas macrotermitis]|uniref:hypothetical protein n=1 Tax=Dysgonomonas macrotermitis TaxID=1346286 RepID=UPI00158745FE|nr:hypothetical protein [Dysgonomonas macrotermitis]
MQTLHPAAWISWPNGKLLSRVVFERQQNNNDPTGRNLPSQLIWKWIYMTKQTKT